MVQSLTIAVLVFFVGAALLLERRCLGKTALVQPLVLCLLGGLLSGEEGICLWLGVSLQLLSIGQSHYCNWVLVSIVSTGAVIVLNTKNIHIEPGTLTSMVLVCTSILIGIFSDWVERKWNRGALAGSKDMSLWRSEKGVDAFATLIYRRVLRGFVFGGLQSIVGVSLATIFAYVAEEKVSLALNPAVPGIVVIAVPIFGVAVTLGSLSGRRYPFFAVIGVLAAMGLLVVL